MLFLRAEAVWLLLVKLLVCWWESSTTDAATLTKFTVSVKILQIINAVCTIIQLKLNSTQLNCIEIYLFYLYIIRFIISVKINVDLVRIKQFNIYIGNYMLTIFRILICLKAILHPIQCLSLLTWRQEQEHCTDNIVKIIKLCQLVLLK